jgi:hypothetical protein
MVLYIYKGQLNMHIQRNSQAISSASNNIATTSQQINQNVLDVIAVGPSVSEPLETAKKKTWKTPQNLLKLSPLHLLELQRHLQKILLQHKLQGDIL